MTELGYEVPTIGEKHQASDQRVSTALTEIKTVFNGRLTANNFAKETITVKKFIKSAGWKNEGTFGKQIKVGEQFISAAVTEPTMAMISLVPSAPTKVAILVGTTKIATANGGHFRYVLSFRLLSGETWTVENLEGGELNASSAFAYIGVA